MDPSSVAMLALQLGAPTIQMIQGIKQGRESKRLSENLTDPVYNIPSSAEAALANAEAMARSRYMPGQTALQNRIEQSTANAMGDVMRFSRSPQDAMSAITAIGARNNDMELDLASRSAMDYQNRQRELRQQQGVMADYQDKKWTNDVLNKFLRDSAAASALKNASMRNKYEAAKGAFNAGGTFIGNNADEFNGLFQGTRSSSAGVTPIDSVGTDGLQVPQGNPRDNQVLMGNTTSPVLAQSAGVTPDQLQQMMQVLNKVNYNAF
jgi:hypothetical protein